MDVPFTSSSGRAVILAETAFLMGVWLATSTLFSPSCIGLGFICLTLLRKLFIRTSLVSSSRFSFLASVCSFDEGLANPVGLV